ncbi:MAG: MFS transporter [Litoreibacter sp.]|nr:MFS transporter [Litoreibacter sp.]MCY4335448.1 MFS transporter [Litoreibacter sp.]
MFEPLANRTYATLFSAQVIALLGTGLTTVALALLAFELAGETAGQVLGTALAIKMVAYVTLAPIAGGLAPLVPRRAYLVTLDLMRAGLVLCLPFVTEIWQIYALIFLLQACSAGFTPVFQATIPDILEEEEVYTKALSLSRLAYDLESLVSPALAAAALLVMNFNGLFAANAAAFAVSAALVLSTSLGRRPIESAPEKFWTGSLSVCAPIWRHHGCVACSLCRWPWQRRARWLLSIRWSWCKGNWGCLSGGQQFY